MGLDEGLDQPGLMSQPKVTTSVQAAPTGWCPLDAYRAEFRDRPKGIDAVIASARDRVRRMGGSASGLLKRANRIRKLHEGIRQESDHRLRERLADVACDIRMGRESPKLISESLGLLCEASSRTLGLLPHPVQIAAALAMHDGRLVELATGEGKSLSIALAATLAGWRGRGCHVVTTNDYLAGRDAATMQPFYSFTGVSVGSIVQDATPSDRRAAYAADITYVTNKDVVADYLRDCLRLGPMHTRSRMLLHRIANDGRPAGGSGQVMRGLAFAIVDEADSVLIDNAATPLIIAQQRAGDTDVQACELASQLADKLDFARDYHTDRSNRSISLTHRGRRKLKEAMESQTGWPTNLRSNELLRQALTAREFYERDKHYLVRDDEVVLMDEFTGRLMPDRRWRNGLHQAVEALEGVPIKPADDTLSRISFQRYFCLYPTLAGTTGTAWEQSRELWRVYRLPTTRLPTHKPCVRSSLPDRVCANADEKWRRVIDVVKQKHEKGQPILLGTGSVLVSEHLSELLTQAGLEHKVLNAERHQEEAAIVARAGKAGQITVATNMAGRGTDIKLDVDVRPLGGLHVLSTQRHEARRIDRQLIGRCARQGDPGSCETIVSLDDDLFKRFAPSIGRAGLKIVPLRTPPGQWLARWAFRVAQKRAQNRAAISRRGVQRADDWLDDYLDFASKTL